VSALPCGKGDVAVVDARATVTVIIVSDYEGTGLKSWANERAALRALGAQDFAEPFEVILIEREELRTFMPLDVLRECPGSRVEFCTATTSAGLKDEGARRARGDLIAILEADCTPARDWLRRIVSTLRERPDCAAVSGKTLYPGRSVFVRCLTLLDRSWLDPGGSGPTPGLCNNNSILRRDVLAKYPYPAAPTPFLSAGLRWHAMRGDNLRFFFDARAVVYHALPSWSFVKDMRCHSGYSVSAQTGSRLPAILEGLVRRLYLDIRRCWRLRRHYAVAWYEVPLAWALAVVARFYEFKGARYARHGAFGLPWTTSYR
jgi:hypothetical protein